MIALKKIFFEWMELQLISNPDIYLLTLDVGFPDILPLLERFPNQVLNLGVCEQNALLVACGLGRSEPCRVYVYGISSFTLWRGAEILKLYQSSFNHVTIIGNGGGTGYGLMGESHHSLNDYGLLTLINSSTRIFLPLNSKMLLDQLSESLKYPEFQYFRLINPSRLLEDLTQSQGPEDAIKRTPHDGLSVRPSEQSHLSTGTIVVIGPSWLPKIPEQDLFFITQWPCSIELILSSANKTKQVTFYEEHQYTGGISQQIQARLFKDVKVTLYTLPNRLKVVGSRDHLLELYFSDTPRDK